MRRYLSITLLAAALTCAAAGLEQAVERRKAGDLSQAERLLRSYSSPANFEQLSYSDKVAFMRGLLELAHVRALKDDVPGALLLLNWAEGRSDDYLRAVACVKYAEILLDLDEPERASGYLGNAAGIIARRVSGRDDAEGVAIGQGGETADAGAAWRELRDEADALNAGIEAETLKRKFGATYGNYVRLRRLQRLAKRSRVPRYLNEAMAVADEIVDTDPASQFAAAAGYLKGEILASRLKEDSPKKEIREVRDCLEEFVKARPDGLYRGEALMLLGKISLEVEWNAREAEKYYSQALERFRRAREKRDAVSLYAPISDDLKRQAAPARKPTTLNQWKRIVYHDEDPLGLYNTASAPAWYVDDKEKNCLFMLGFCRFTNSDFAGAKDLWEKGGKLDTDICRLEAEDFPNLLMRMKTACAQGFLVTDAAEHKGLSGKERLNVLIGEFYYLEEKFEKALAHWRNLQKVSGISPACRATAIMGEADCLRMLPGCDAKVAASLYGKVIRDRKLSETPLKARAMYNLAWITLQTSSKNREAANALFEECIRENKKSKYAEASLFYLVVTNLSADYDLASKHARRYRSAYPDGVYLKRIELRLKQHENKQKEKVER